MGCLAGGPLADADQQVVFADDHHIPAFQRHLAVIAFPWQKEVVMGVRQLYDLFLVLFEQGMIEEDIFGQKRFPCTGLFGRLVEQHIIVNDNADVPGKDKVWDGGEKHLLFTQRTADKSLGQLYRVQFLELQLRIVGAGFDGAYRGYQF